MTPDSRTLLSTINSPSDIKLLNGQELNQLCDELRSFILDVVSVHPGHLGSSLGAVELTVALHKVFNTPYDKLVWDVGHQAYGHKILTGRRDTFYTNRQFGGICGFPVRNESEYDAFGTGHSSTSVSAALGMAEASRLKGENDRKHIAVIGDGALTGGMAIEGMNNAGTTNADILVVLNDNGISIDENVGSLKNYFSEIAESSRNDFKRWKALGIAFRNAYELSYDKKTLEGKFQRKSNLFEAMNFRYFGPVDGHDVDSLVEVLTEVRNIPGPKLLHVITTKGKGFKKAEEEQTLFHAPGKFDRQTGDIIKDVSSKKNVTYQEVYGRTLLDLAHQNDKIIGITPAMPTGSALTYMRDSYPDRVFDVGIAEQHAVTFAAGLAAEGFKPFCTIYSTFLQRAYDQVIHDVALQNLPVVFAIDRAGLVGEDGATHHGIFDLAFMSSVPGMIVAAPVNEGDLRNMMFTAAGYRKGPFSVRYPRGSGVIGDNWNKVMKELPIGKAVCLRSGEGIAVLSIGHAGNFVIDALNNLERESVRVAHYDMRYLAPLDQEVLHNAFSKYHTVVTVEDGIVSGGLASKAAVFKSRNNYESKLITLGVQDMFVTHGDVKTLHDYCGYSPKAIENTIKGLI